MNVKIYMSARTTKVETNRVEFVKDSSTESIDCDLVVACTEWDQEESPRRRSRPWRNAGSHYCC